MAMPAKSWARRRGRYARLPLKRLVVAALPLPGRPGRWGMTVFVFDRTRAPPAAMGLAMYAEVSAAAARDSERRRGEVVRMLDGFTWAMFG